MLADRLLIPPQKKTATNKTEKLILFFVFVCLFGATVGIMRSANNSEQQCPNIQILPVPHYSYELPMEEEERFEKLFKQLDVNGDGRIDIVELSQSLHKHGVPDNLKESYATVNSTSIYFCIL